MKKAIITPIDIPKPPTQLKSPTRAMVTATAFETITKDLNVTFNDLQLHTMKKELRDALIRF